MNLYLEETRTLVSNGEYSQALERMIWYHNNALKHDPSQSAVRLSFALKDWIQLGEMFPKAITSLKSIRDRKTHKIHSGTTEFNLFKDVFAINKYLEDKQSSIDLFVTLAQEKPQLGKILAEIIGDFLYTNKRYDIIQKYLGEPIELFNWAKSLYKTSNQLEVSKEIYQHCSLHFQESKYEEAIEAEMAHGNGELTLEKLKD